MISQEIKSVVRGEVAVDEKMRQKFARDASIFAVEPAAVVFPQNTQDIKDLVKFVAAKKSASPSLSITPRAAGTDMSGGSLTDSILISLTEHMNKIIAVGQGFAVAEPGVMYRDFEIATLKTNQIFPSFPASKNICALGGIVGNNAGGEKSLRYGKTIDYVKALKVVLRDGEEYRLTSEPGNQLTEKTGLEGEIYRSVYELLTTNYQLIQRHRPKVSKNSSGYQIWDVIDRTKNTINLAKLFVGSQGTLGIITQIKLGLVPVKKRHGLLIAFMRDFDNLPEIIRTVLKYKPDSFESFDNYTFKLALRYFSSFGEILKTNLIGLAFQFIPEIFQVAVKGTPRLVLLIEFEENDQRVIDEEVKNLVADLAKFANVYLKFSAKDREAEKYWAIRRESFNLLRHAAGKLKSVPFIDDLCVVPEVLPEFLPQLYKILDDGKLLYTVAGHVGDANFHIIPLMDLSQEEERAKIYSVGEKVFALVLKYGGSLSGEHNDGLIRSPYLEKQFGPEIYKIFSEIKRIFDPQNIFNPHKKIGVTKEDAQKYIIQRE